MMLAMSAARLIVNEPCLLRLAQKRSDATVMADACFGCSIAMASLLKCMYEARQTSQSRLSTSHRAAKGGATSIRDCSQRLPLRNFSGSQRLNWLTRCRLWGPAANGTAHRVSGANVRLVSARYSPVHALTACAYT